MAIIHLNQRRVSLLGMVYKRRDEHLHHKMVVDQAEQYGVYGSSTTLRADLHYFEHKGLVKGYYEDVEGHGGTRRRVVEITEYGIRVASFYEANFFIQPGT